jgi:2-polyprenyl-6-methoxyphenol hydroxylase-like FAD-dependent oxidoreductase
MSSLKNKRILISGASIAGPALAFWLKRYGFEPSLVERAPSVRAGGYAVDFRGAALRLLEKMDLLEEVRKFEIRTSTVTIVDKNNKRITNLPDGFTSGELEIHPASGLLYCDFHASQHHDPKHRGSLLWQPW